MKKGVVLVCILAFFTTAYAKDKEQENKNLFGVSLNAGIAVPTQAIANLVHGGAGATLGFDFIYEANKNVLVGLETNWDTHDAKTSGVSLGSIKTFSLAPFLEIKSTQDKKVFPYFSIGIGTNFNYFDENAILGGVNITPSNTLFLKPAIGLEFLVKDNLSLSTEIAWKSNTGTFSYSDNSPQEDFNSSSLLLLFKLTPYWNIKKH